MADIDENIKKEDVKVYRFKFTPEIMNLLHEFAQIHKYDEKEVYKEEWDKWTKVNNEIIQKEENRLLDLGWNGKIKDKMFKSAKYYFRNKTNIEKEPKKRKKYTRVTNNLRITIDRHIPQCIINNDKPSCLILSRQGLPLIRNDFKTNKCQKGAYFIKETKNSKITLFASGSELSQWKVMYKYL